MVRLRRTFILWLMLCLSFGVQAQMESHLTYRRYVTQDGLPQMQTERLWQDSKGYIYIGTLSGFVRFDGHAFAHLLKGRLNIVGFAEVEDEVRALGFFRQWRVDYDGVEAMPLDPQGHWLLNNLNAGSLPNGYVLLEDSLEEHRRLCLMTKEGFKPLIEHRLLDEMMPDRKLYYDAAKSEAIVPTESGLWRIKTGKATKISEKSDVFSLMQTDSTLLAFASDGIYAVEGKGLRLIHAFKWSAVSYGLTVRKLRSGSVVIADEHTVYIWDGTCIKEIMSGINLIRDVLVDRWDRLWVGTYQGVYQFFNRCFTNHRLSDENDIVRAVAIDDAGQLVMGTLNGKLMVGDSVISDDAEQFFAPNAAKLGGKVYFAGNSDVVCIATEKEERKAWSVKSEAMPSFNWLGLPHDRYQFVASAWGQLIVGSRTCITAWQPETGVLDTLTTEILHPWCATEGADGLLWIGSSSGLFSINQKHEVNKLEYPSQKLIITALVADHQGSIVFASADSLFMIKNGQIETLNQQIHELCGHEVRSLFISPRGYLVVAVVDGLFVCHIDKNYQLSDIHFFDHLNGFTMTEPLKAMMAESSNGTVWLPGVEQMTSFNPEELLAHNEEDTYIAPPLRWWQHWWVWLAGVLLLALLVWAVTRWYEKRRNHLRMVRLQREKLWREEQIEAIRKKALEVRDSQNYSPESAQAESPQTESPQTALAEDIVKMTEKSYEERITLRTASGTIVVDVKDIAYFKGDGNYSQIVTFHDTDTVLIGLGALAKMLSPEIFVRADRSTLVNLHHIYSLLPKQRLCIFRSPTGQEVKTTLLAPAFKRLQELLY
ncbi:MAG: LytTR family transcriptional regulator [Bacteroidaceae bacterium]|nr:LytTR family transcriptional regulator [Bacteroidaceae bacterium]